MRILHPRKFKYVLEAMEALKPYGPFTSEMVWANILRRRPNIVILSLLEVTMMLSHHRRVFGLRCELGGHRIPNRTPVALWHPMETA